MIRRMQPYERRYLIRLVCWLATLVLIYLVGLAASPLNTATRQAVFAGAAVILCGANIVLGRLRPIAPCPSCRLELFRAFTAARRAGADKIQCPRCGAHAQV